MTAGLAFGMSTDACYDAAYHPQAAIFTVLAGTAVVLVATGGVMCWGVTHGRVVVAWPLGGLLGLGAVFALGLVVVH